MFAALQNPRVILKSEMFFILSFSELIFYLVSFDSAEGARNNTTVFTLRNSVSELFSSNWDHYESRARTWALLISQSISFLSLTRRITEKASNNSAVLRSIKIMKNL